MEYTMQSFIDNVIMKSEVMKEQYNGADNKDELVKKYFKAMCQLHNDDILKGDLSWFGSENSIKNLEQNLDIDTEKFMAEKYITPICTIPKLLEKEKGDAFVEFFKSVKQVAPERFRKTSGEIIEAVTNDIIDAHKTVTDTESEFDYKKYMKAMTKLKLVRNLHKNHVKGEDTEYVEYSNIFIHYPKKIPFGGIDNYSAEEARVEETKEMLDNMIYEADNDRITSGARFYSKGAEESIRFFAKEGMAKQIIHAVDTKTDKESERVYTMCNLKNLDILKKGYHKFQSLLNYTSASDEIRNEEIDDKDFSRIKTQKDAKKYIFKHIGKKSFVELAPAMIKYKQLGKAMINEPNHGKLDVSELKNTISAFYKNMEADNYAITSISNTDKYNKMSKCLKKIATTNDKNKLEEFLANHLDDVIDTVKTYRNYKLKDTRNSQRGNNRLKQSSKILDVLTKFKDDFEYSKTTKFSDVYKDDPSLNNKQLNYWVIHEDNLDKGERPTKHEDIISDCENYNSLQESRALERQQKNEKNASIDADRPNLRSFLNPLGF